MMGSGGMIVLSDKDCMPAMAKFYLGFTKDESCGKCTPCRIGTRRMLEMLEKICAGNGTEEMLDELENLANTIKDTALCGLGQTAPNPILSTLRYFKDEYIAHVRDKKCPAGTCRKLFKLVITDAKLVFHFAGNADYGAPVGAAILDRIVNFAFKRDFLFGFCELQC